MINIRDAFGEYTVEEVAESFDHYTAEELADNYVDFISAITVCLTPITMLPLVKMIEHAEHADAMGKIIGIPDPIDAQRTVAHQLTTLRRLAAIQRDLFAASGIELPA